MIPAAHITVDWLAYSNADSDDYPPPVVSFHTIVIVRPI